MASNNLIKMKASDAVEWWKAKSKLFNTIEGLVKALKEAGMAKGYILNSRCRCDICNRSVGSDEDVYQDLERPFTVCVSCYSPNEDYSLKTKCSFNVSIEEGRMDEMQGE